MEASMKTKESVRDAHVSDDIAGPEEGVMVERWKGKLTYLKWYFTSKAGWLGDYVSQPA
jgi:hypothetical protein